MQTRPAELEASLAALWEDLLNVPTVGLDEDFFDLGGDSIIAARLFAMINKTYDVNLVLSTLFEARTIGQLADAIRAAQATPNRGSQSTGVVRLQHAYSRTPLFVISGLGGNVLNLRELASHLSDACSLYALQPRGLDGKQPYHTRVEEIAHYYVNELQQIQPKGPYFLAGYSFGGLIAFEVAQQLVYSGEVVGFLGLLDSMEHQYLIRVKRGLSRKDRAALYKSRLYAVLFGENRWDYLTKRLRETFSLLSRRALAVIGIDAPAWGNISDINSYAATIYRPKIYPGAITIFRTSDREILDGDDEFLGWRELVTSPLTVRRVPGNHYTMIREPNVRVLAEQLRASLEEVQNRPDIHSPFSRESALGAPS